MVSTLAGTGAADGPASEATFNFPSGIAIGSDGSLYVADRNNNKIRKVTVNGSVSTYAGTGTSGPDNGSCTAATFRWPHGVAMDAANNVVYVADFLGDVIRKITSTPCQVSTLAGDGHFGASDGMGTLARFDSPAGLTMDASGNIYIADSENHKIRKVTPDGNVITIAGTGAVGKNNGQVMDATFNWPSGIAVDAEGTLYVTEIENNDIRKITFDVMGNPLTVSTLAGSGAAMLTDGVGLDAAFNSPTGLAIDASGNLLVADTINNVVRQVTPDGVVTTIAGQGGVAGAHDGPADMATFNHPYGVAVDSNGVIYVADTGNNKIRKLTPVPQ